MYLRKYTNSFDPRNDPQGQLFSIAALFDLHLIVTKREFPKLHEPPRLAGVWALCQRESAEAVQFSARPPLNS